MPPAPETVLLEEYKALRSELLTCFHRSDSRLALAWAGVAALIGAAAVARLPELGFLACGIVVAAWRDHQSLYDAVERLSAYIQVAIEPRVAGLQWEGIVTGLLQEDEDSNSTGRRYYSAVVSSYGVFAWAVLLATATLLAVNPPDTVTRRAVDAAFSVLSVIAVMMAIRRHVGLTNRKRYWRQRFATLIAQRSADRHSDPSPPQPPMREA